MTNTREPLLAEVIDLIVESLNLHFVEKSELGPETVLGLGGLELDSIDILEVVVGIEKRYSIKIKNAEEGKKVFASIGSIIEFIQENQGASSESGQPKS